MATLCHYFCGNMRAPLVQRPRLEVVSGDLLGVRALPWALYNPDFYQRRATTQSGHCKGVKGVVSQTKSTQKLYLSKLLNANGSIGMCLKEEQTDDKVARVTLRNTRRTADKAPDTSDLNVLTSWPSEAGSKGGKLNHPMT